MRGHLPNSHSTTLQDEVGYYPGITLMPGVPETVTTVTVVVVIIVLIRSFTDLVVAIRD